MAETSTTTILLNADQYRVMLENYASILEKTNDQLSVWSNPYGIMIGILTLLFAAGAIIVSILLYKNSRDQKNAVESFLQGLEKINKERMEKIDELEEKRKEEANRKFGTLIEELKKRLESTSVEGKKEIEKIITELKREKAAISMEGSVAGLYSSIIGVPGEGWGGPMLGRNDLKVCSKCGTLFRDNNLVSAWTIESPLRPNYNSQGTPLDVLCQRCKGLI